MANESLSAASNVATTLNLYVHPNIDQKKRCIERLNKFLKADNIS